MRSVRPPVGKAVRWGLTALVVLGSLAGVSAAPQSARSANIWSPHYDVRIEVLPDGSLDVVERVTLEIGPKTATWFDRTVPRRRTDGFANVVALMDGQAVPVSIDTAKDLKIRWDFSPTANAAHTFEMRYRALHVLGRELDGPRLVWTALPRRHTYPIEASEISLFAPAGAAATYVGAPGGAVLPATPDRPGVVIAGQALRRSDTITVDVTFAPNSISPAEPQWFIEQDRQLNMMPAWLAGAASLLAVGLGILIMSFARLSKPKAPEPMEIVPASEGAVPAGLAAFLVARSHGSTWLALQSAIFRFVRDGAVKIEKRDGSRRAFDVSAVGPDPAAITPHEAWILEQLRGLGGAADLRKVMMRLTRRQTEFRRLLMADAASRGWIDSERLRARSWLAATGLVLVFSGIAGTLAMVALTDRFGPAPIAIPAVIIFTGVLYLITSAGTSVLSEEGVREAARWKARVAEIKETIRQGVSGQSPKDFERWFPLAIGAGLGRRWLKAFQPQLADGRHDLAWLNTIGSANDAMSSLAAVMAASGASHAGGAGGVGGGAGGGSSGAG